MKKERAIFGWLTVGFAALFGLALVVFAMGIVDLREGGEAGFAVVFLVLAPMLFFGFIWLVLLALSRLAANSPISGSTEPGDDASVDIRTPGAPGR